MMIGLLAAGIAAIVAGVLAIAYGFMLELSFGNTLILAGAFQRAWKEVREDEKRRRRGRRRRVVRPPPVWPFRRR